MKKILATTDLSEESKSGLRMARTLAEPFGAQVTVMSVSEIATEGPPQVHGHTSDAYLRRVKSMLQERLDEVRADVFNTGSQVDTALVDGKVVWQTICQYAAEHGFDMIVIASHGRSGVQRALIGSVAERVVRGASCPVITVPTQDPKA